MALAELKYVSTRGNAYSKKEDAEIDSILHKIQWPVVHLGEATAEHINGHNVLVQAITVAFQEAGYWIDDPCDDEDDDAPTQRKSKVARPRPKPIKTRLLRND